MTKCKTPIIEKGTLVKVVKLSSRRIGGSHLKVAPVGLVHIVVCSGKSGRRQQNRQNEVDENAAGDMPLYHLNCPLYLIQRPVIPEPRPTTIKDMRQQIKSLLHDNPL